MHQARRPASDNREANPVTIKPAAASHVDSSSWGSLNCCSPPRHPFPRKSFALLARVSSWKVHFWVLGKSPLSGHRKGVPPRPATESEARFQPPRQVLSPALLLEKLSIYQLVQDLPTILCFWEKRRSPGLQVPLTHFTPHSTTNS